jgi:hypothetical protein
MSSGRIRIIIALLLLAALIASCNFVAPTESPKPTETSNPQMTVIVEPTSSSPQVVLRSEAEVPRTPVDQAKAALDSGAVVIVDVRSAQAYEASHVKGAISIPLSEIETNINGLSLEKNQWIITYCT